MKDLAIFIAIMLVMWIFYGFGYMIGFTRGRSKKKKKKSQILYCFECEIEMPVKEKNGRLHCLNCGLRH